MLDADALAATLTQAQKAANCGPFCRISSGTEAGTYLVSHNGIGSGDSDQQRVYANAMLLLSDVQLQPHLVSWLNALHRRAPRIDLNESIS